MIKSVIKKEFKCNIEELWRIITDNRNYYWRSDVSKIDVIDDTHFLEYNKKNYPTYFTITSNKKFKEYKFEIENTKISGKWTGIFKKIDNDNTEIEFIEEIETHKFLIKLFAKKYLKKQQKRYIYDLEKILNKK